LSRPGLKIHILKNRACPAGTASSSRYLVSRRRGDDDLTNVKKEVKMPKMKTKSGAKKRFRLTASGKVRGSAAFLSHNLRRRSQKMKRKARGTMILCDADARIVKRFLPYA
jgi:large subunit ribosomal protein L35